MNGSIIKNCKVSDIKSVLKIEKKSSFSHWTNEMLLNEINNKFSRFKLICSADNNAVMGYVIYRIVADEAEILNIVVDSLFQGNHLGKKLLEYALDDMKALNVKKIFLEVAESNNIAQNFYTNLNFKQYGTRKNYYNGKNAILMKKEFDF